MKIQDIPGDHKVAAYFPGHATAGTAKSVGLFIAPFDLVVTSVEFIPSAAITGANTNNFTLSVEGWVDGSEEQTIADLQFASGTDAAASDATALTLDETTVPAGTAVIARKLVAGSGLACPDGTVVVTYRSNG